MPFIALSFCSSFYHGLNDGTLSHSFALLGLIVIGTVISLTVLMSDLFPHLCLSTILPVKLVKYLLLPTFSIILTCFPDHYRRT